MSVLYSLFLLGALSLCGLVQAQTVDQLREKALSMPDLVQCKSPWNCDCTFNTQPGCCSGAKDMYAMEDQVYGDLQALYQNIYNLKLQVQKLTTERKIAFHATMDDDVSTNPENCFGPFFHNVPIPFGKVTLNSGNWYHGTHGTFTAPRSGVYVFSYTITSKPESTKNKNYNVALTVAGKPMVAVSEKPFISRKKDDHDKQDSATQYVIVSLKKGEPVNLLLKPPSKLCSSFSGNTFSGFLLYPTEKNVAN